MRWWRLIPLMLSSRGVVERERVGTPFPWIFLCGNAVPIDIFVPVGTAFPLPEFVF